MLESKVIVTKTEVCHAEYARGRTTATEYTESARTAARKRIDFNVACTKRLQVSLTGARRGKQMCIAGVVDIETARGIFIKLPFHYPGAIVKLKDSLLICCVSWLQDESHGIVGGIAVTD